jgi:predicted GTPase
MEKSFVSPLLGQKEEIIVANKLDLATDDSALKKLRKQLPGRHILAISGVSHQGLNDLLEQIWSHLHPKAD